MIRILKFLGLIYLFIYSRGPTQLKEMQLSYLWLQVVKK